MSQDSNVTIILYDGVNQSWFSSEDVRAFINRWMPCIPVEIKGDLLLLNPKINQDESASRELAEQLSQLRVSNPTQERSGERKLLGPEIDYERRVFSGETRANPGVVYDGNDLQRLAYANLTVEDRGTGNIHIWMTERLFATWEESDKRYHLRANVLGEPSIVSTSGMILAPAKDRNFYIARRLGVKTLRPEDVCTEDFLRREDSRTTEVAKGLAMQAIFYNVFGEGFCEEKNCRLFNAHWQKDLLNAQIGDSDFCKTHEKMLRSLGGS